MWLLKDENNEKLIYLKPNATMTVGRNKGDIVLPDDKSISRVHALITVETLPDFNKITEKTQPLSKCTIKDGGSKYGNFLLNDDEPIRIPEDGLKLQHMDRIRFGLQNNIFIVHYIPIITVTSGMSEGGKEKLKKIIDAIDGKIIYAWTPLCTHMTVVKPTISEKLSCALATSTPIVSFDYWNSVTKAFEENKELPDPADFSNSIDNQLREIGNVSVKPNSARQTLLQNLTFVHFSHKQYVIYSRMIKFAGGKSLQYGKQRPLPDVCDDNIIVVQLVESNTTQATGTGDANYAAVCEKLRECRRRTIPESEIAIAILHCSTAKYCNPKFDYAVLFAPRTGEIPPQDTTVLALDTQDVLGPSTSGQSHVNKQKNRPNFIPETVQESYNTEFEPAKKNRANLPNDSADSAESINYRSEEANRSESVAHSVMDDMPSESEIGSMKLASLNYEDYVREEFGRRTSIDEPSAKRDRDSEDDGSLERKKKICFGVSSIDKTKEQDYKDMMPDDDDDFSVDLPMSVVGKGLEKKQGRQTPVSCLSAEELPYKGHTRKDFNKRTSINEKREKRSSAGRLPAEKDLEDFDMSKKRKPSKVIDYFVEDAVSKSTSPSRDGKDSYRNRMVEIGKSQSSEDSITDQQDKSYKRKVGRSDFSPFLDVTENPRKRTKSEIVDERNDSVLKKASSVKRPLMDLPTSSLNQFKTEPQEEDEWISNVAIDYGSEKDTSAVSDSSRHSLARNYDTRDYITFPNDPNATVLPLLRINGPADINTKNGRRFGKCFRKQKIKIPIRVELDGSTYDSWTSENRRQSRSSMDDDDSGKANTSYEVIPKIFSRAKKSCRV